MINLYNILQLKVKIILSLLLTLACIYTVSAQDIRGIVKDIHDRKPIANVSIQIILKEDTLTTLTDNNGYFSAKRIENEIYKVVFRHVSYETYEFNSYTDSLAINLIPKENRLEEVVVKADWITRKDGNFIVNVKAIPNIDKLQADQALRNIPGIVQTEKGKYTLNGKNAIIYINGIKQNITGTSLDAFLSGLPADSMASIELIPINAGDYNSSVEAVINIRTDENIPLGYLIQPSISSSIQDRRMDETEAGLFWMRKWNNILFHSTLSYSYDRNRSHSLDSLVISQNDWLTNRTYMVGYLNALNYQGSLKYRLKNENSLQADVFIYNDFGKSTSDWSADYNFTVENRDTRSDLYNLALSYHIQTNKNKFNGVASYSISYGGKHADTNTKDDIGYPRNGNLDMEGWMHNVSADFRSSLNDWIMRYGTSLDYNKVWDKTLYKVNGMTGNLSAFSGWEFLVSTYMIAKYRFNDKFSLQTGLRLENTSYHYKDEADKKLHTSHTDLFPTLLFYADLRDWYMVVGGSSQTVRPNYEYMLPGEHYMNDYIVKRGNPDVVPTNIYRLLLYNTFFNALHLNFEYIYIKDALGTTHAWQDGMLYQSYDNMCDTHYYEGYLTVPFSFLDNKLTGQVQAQAIYKNIASLNKNTVIPVGRKKDQWIWKFNASVNYMPTERIYLSATATYSPRQIATYFYNNSKFSVDANASWSFLKDKCLTAEIQIERLFGKHHRSVNYFLDKQKMNFIKNQGAIIRFALRWKFRKGQRIEEEYKDYNPRTSRF